MNWLGALLEWQFLLCGTLCFLHLDLPPRLILSRPDGSLTCSERHFTICCNFSFIGATMLMPLSTVSTTCRCIAQETFREFVRVINATIIVFIIIKRYFLVPTCFQSQSQRQCRSALVRRQRPLRSRWTPEPQTRRQPAPTPAQPQRGVA